MIGHGHHGKGHFFGTVKVGERGQVVIPKEARELFSIEPGDKLIVVGRKGRGIGLMKADSMKAFALKMMEHIGFMDEE